MKMTFIYTDVEIFLVAPLMNVQNDRVFEPIVTKKREVSAQRPLYTR